MAAKETPSTAALALVDPVASGMIYLRSREPDGGADQEEQAPVVKKRRTKNYKLREDATKARRSVVLRLPPFEPQSFDNWEQFIQAWTQYMARTKTLYRRRSSSTTAYWNTKHKFKKYNVPDTFQYATMAYWCTHGCIQPSRGQGVRTHLHNRYTGCSARITADVVCEPGENGEMRWCVRVRNQISQHNHRISDEIYNCYSNNSSVPDELLLGAQVESEQQPSASAATRNFDGEETDFDAPTRMISDLEAGMDVDTVAGLTRSPGASSSYGSRGTVRGHSAHASHSGTALGPTLLLKEVLADDQKINMATSELQPVISELKRTSSRVIHKRLQDVSDMVVTLLAKWHQDRLAEESALPAVINSGGSSSDDQPGSVPTATAADPSFTTSTTTIASLPAGSQFFLASRPEPTTNVDIALRASGESASGVPADDVAQPDKGVSPHDDDTDEERDVGNSSVV